MSGTLQASIVKDSASSTSNLTLDASGNVAVGNNLTVAGTATLTGNIIGNITTTGTVVMGSSFLRNRIINGDMRIDQRNAGASVTPTGSPTYTLDRWELSFSQPSKLSIQQNAGSVTPPSGFTKYLGVTSLSAYSVLSTDNFRLDQPIEGFNVADLNWGTASAATVTVSFWVRSSLTGVFGFQVTNYFATRVYPTTYTINSANTWEQKTITIPGDTTGTWETGNLAGVRIGFQLGYGSSYSGAGGAWNAGTVYAVTGATSVVGTNGATFYITGVQLEVGSNATPFERRQYGEELMLCQRYYELGQARWRGQDASATVVWTNSFKVTKRTTPTMAGTATIGNSLLNSNAFSLEATGVGTVDTGTVSWTASAEL